MKLNKLRKAAMTIEFVIVVSILVLIGCLGTAYVYSNYDTLVGKANQVEDYIINSADGVVDVVDPDNSNSVPDNVPDVLTVNISFGDSLTPTSINYEEGMTWYDWVNSEYNIYNNDTIHMESLYGNVEFYHDDGYFILAHGYIEDGSLYSGSFVEANELIDFNNVYVWEI